jgi:23S rRNA pseudouridine2605 synthase
LYIIAISQDVIPEVYLNHMHPVGRLDADTSGLLLLSSDGVLTHKLLQPKFKVEREYTCTVEPNEGMPPPGEALIAKLADGVLTSDGYVLKLCHKIVLQLKA